MKKLLVLFCFLLKCVFSTSCFAQNQNNYFQIISTASLNYLLSSPSDVETPYVATNAIGLRVFSKNNNCTVYARLNSFTYPTGFSPTNGLFALKWNYDISNKDYNLVTSTIPLSNTDQFLFNQKKMPSNANTYDYFYDLIFTTPGYLLVPGIYNFSILFTMTQP